MKKSNVHMNEKSDGLQKRFDIKRQKKKKNLIKKNVDKRKRFSCF